MTRHTLCLANPLIIQLYYMCILLTHTGTVLSKGNVSLLCFARFLEREIARKTEINVGGKWQCPLITEVKRSHIVYKTMIIAVGLDK